MLFRSLFGGVFSFPALDVMDFLALLFGVLIDPDKNFSFDGVDPELPEVPSALGELTLLTPSMFLTPPFGKESKLTYDTRLDGVAFPPLLVGVDVDALFLPGVSIFSPVIVVLSLKEKLV